MAAFLAACGGFLLAVLWMDLMFDVQARHLARTDPAAALTSIAAYYRRVTTDAAPMHHLIGLVMLLQVAGIAGGLLTRAIGGWAAPAAVVLGAGPIALASIRIFPDAVRIGRAADPLATQARLARRIYRGHLLCFAAIAAFTALHVRLARG